MAPRKKHAAPLSEGAAPPPPAQEPPAAAGGEVDPFPHNIRSVTIGGLTIRLNQDRDANEMRIQFGDGRPEDKPSDTVLDLIRRPLVPEELKTTQERAAGEDVPWFKFRGDPETGAGSWRMWIRNHPNAARRKAEQVFNAVVEQVAEERAAGRGR